MKLIQEVSLEYRSLTTHKLYEVNLCEVGIEQFVVDVRYGRHGSTLREGTKTPTPVSETEAVQLFHDLVNSKEHKGYTRRESSHALRSDFDSTVGSSGDQTHVRSHAILKCLSVDNTSKGRWSRSRAAWRCGELQLCQAEPLLIDLIGSGDELLDYSIAWALGRCGSAQCVDSLRRMESTHGAPAVRRIAAVSLLEVLDTVDFREAITELTDQLPQSLRDSCKNGPPDEFADEMNRVLVEKGCEAGYVPETVYLIDNRYVRPALLEFLRTVRFESGLFDCVRHIFKAAELRQDAEVIGIVARQFELIPSSFRMHSDWAESGHELPTTREDLSQVYSRKTRTYLRQRVWRMLQRVGDAKQAFDYTNIAVGILQAFSDEDARPATQEHPGRPTHHARSTLLESVHFDRYAKYFVFNRILYGNSRRYEFESAGLRCRCVPPFEPGNAVPSEREEAYPELWDQYPESVLDLLLRSRCEPVHQFGVKVLREAPNFSSHLEFDDLLMLLKSPYEVTNRFGFELALSLYSAATPNLQLVRALADSACQEAREQAMDWIDVDVPGFFQSTDLVVALLSGPNADTREFGRDRLRNVVLSETTMQIIAGRLMVRLHEFDLEDRPVLANMVETLLMVCGTHLRQVSEDVIWDLLGHVAPEVHRFAGDLVLCHATFSSDPPDDVIPMLIQSEHETVRDNGVRIIGQLPNRILLDSVELLAGLTRHDLADIRIAIRPTVRRLSESSRKFGECVARCLIDALLIPGAAAGVPTHTARILREDLSSHLTLTESDPIRALLHSRSRPAQEIGELLLVANLRSVEFSVNEIVEFASHEILSVRELAWKLMEDDVPMMLAESEVAVKIADSCRKDTRQFAFLFLREHFSEAGAVSPDVLISLCDSTCADVQQFGRSLVTQLLEAEHGEEYLVKLSEHPAGDMQLLVSEFLEQHVSDNPDRLRQLAPFFLTLLSRISSGRAVRTHALAFLRREAVKDERSARVAAEILSQISATAVISDRAAVVELLFDIQVAWPQIVTPLTVKSVEVRNGV